MWGGALGQPLKEGLGCLRRAHCPPRTWFLVLERQHPGYRNDLPEASEIGAPGFGTLSTSHPVSLPLRCPFYALKDLCSLALHLEILVRINLI